MSTAQIALVAAVAAMGMLGGLLLVVYGLRRTPAGWEPTAPEGGGQGATTRAQ